MNINATLFVQAGNFFIAYLLFRFILLKPAYQELQQDAADQYLLEELVAGDKRNVEQERQEQRDAWHQFRRWCASHRPALISMAGFFRVAVPRVPAIKLDPAAQKKIQHQFETRMLHAIKDRYGV